MMPAASSRSSSAGLSGCCDARGVRADLLQVVDEQVHVRAVQPVAVALGVLVDRRAAQDDRLAVEQQLGAAGRDLAQAGARRVAGLAGHLEAQVVEVRRARRPQGGAGTSTEAVTRSSAVCRHLGGREGERVGLRAAGQRALRGDRAGRAAVVDDDADVDLAVVPARRVRTVGALRSLAPSGRIVTSRLMPAEVEPGPVPALDLHARRVAPVDAHDDLVGPLGGGCAPSRTAGTRRGATRASCRRSTRSRGGSPTRSSARSGRAAASDLVRYQATLPSKERRPAIPVMWSALGTSGTAIVEPSNAPAGQAFVATRVVRSPRSVHGPARATRPVAPPTATGSGPAGAWTVATGGAPGGGRGGAVAGCAAEPDEGQGGDPGHEHRRAGGEDAQANHHASSRATARVGPAEPPTIRRGKQDTVNPVGGSAARLHSRSIWQ